MTAGTGNQKDGAGRESAAAAAAADGDGAEVAEEHVEVVRYAAAIDVARGPGMACTQVPGSRPDRERQKARQVEASYGSVVTLMDHLNSSAQVR
jgi:hypothetical protein